MYLLLFISILLFAFFLKKYFFKLKLDQSFKVYLSSIARIQDLQNNKNNTNEILNNISSSGINLLIKLVLLLLPYLTIFYYLQKYFEYNVFFVTLLPLLPYLVIFKKRI